MSVDQAVVLQLRAVTEADPGVLCRILQHFQALNVVPRRVFAQRVGSAGLEVDIEVIGLAPETLQRVAAKVGQMPMVVVAVVRNDR